MVSLADASVIRGWPRLRRCGVLWIRERRRSATHYTRTSKRSRMKLCFAVLVTHAVLLTACGDATRPPATGQIGVRVVASGPDADRDTYAVFVDGKRQDRLLNGAMIVRDVPAGAHDVWLNGYGTNCDVGDGESRRVTV